MLLTHLLSQYGYLAVLVGSLLEGETVLVLAGFGSHQGYLSLPLVILLACIGGVLGDQFFFFLGRHYGTTLLARFPRLAARAQPVNKLIEHHHTRLIFGVRFMYGLRIVGPLMLGMSQVSTWRFVVFNLLGAVVWASLFSGAGYLFGQTLAWILTDLKRYEELILALIIAVAIIAILLHRRRRS